MPFEQWKPETYQKGRNPVPVAVLRAGGVLDVSMAGTRDWLGDDTHCHLFADTERGAVALKPCKAPDAYTRKLSLSGGGGSRRIALRSLLNAHGWLGAGDRVLDVTVEDGLVVLGPFPAPEENA